MPVLREKVFAVEQIKAVKTSPPSAAHYSAEIAR
jgi:hypothetical protein